jgi:hypothetical protein
MVKPKPSKCKRGLLFLHIAAESMFAVAHRQHRKAHAPSWRIGAGGLRFAHPPYELLGKSIHAQYRSIAPRLGNEAR